MSMTITIDDTMGQAIIALAAQLTAAAGSVPVHANTWEVRTHGLFDPVTKEIMVTTGPFAGIPGLSPSGAARRLVAHYNPTIASPHRNGWMFWRVSDTGMFLDSLRDK